MPQRDGQQSSEWLSVRDVATEVGIGLRTVYAAVRSGQLRAAAVNARGDLRVHRDWLRSWLEQRADLAR